MQKKHFDNFGILYNGHVLEVAKSLPNESVDCVITSPPYWQLRDYGHPWGLEPTYQEYLAHLQELMKEIWRVLKPNGTVWVNLGDTYSKNVLVNNNGKGESTYHGGLKEHLHTQIPIKTVKQELPDKCLMLIPHRFAINCIDNGWILRNDIIWAKPNGMPESVTDRFSKKHEFVFFFVKSQKYYFDLDSVRQKTVSKNSKHTNPKKHSIGLASKPYIIDNPLGKNCGDVSDFWEIPTIPSSKNHYATFNDRLIRKPILAGCPKGGVIYDPFMGSGTTAAAALHYDRQFVGSEINQDYFNQSVKMVGELVDYKKSILSLW